MSALLHPPPHLSSCVFAAIVRDTRGVVLDDMERFNHFPASPLVSVTFIVNGGLHLVPTGCTLAEAGAAPPVSRISVVPPQVGPVSSWSAGEVAVATVAIYPDAWIKLGKCDAQSDVCEALANAFGDFQEGDDFEAHWTAFCDTVGPIWHQVRDAGGLADWSGSKRLTDWSHSIMGRAALAGPGRSMRAFERRLRRWSQHSQQSLKFFADFEDLHRLRRHQPTASLAEIASDAGYADQSHMGRAVRRGTGFSPAQLNRLIETKEAFWCYRLLGERF